MESKVIKINVPNSYEGSCYEQFINLKNIPNDKIEYKLPKHLKSIKQRHLNDIEKAHRLKRLQRLNMNFEFRSYNECYNKNPDRFSQNRFKIHPRFAWMYRNQRSQSTWSVSDKLRNSPLRHNKQKEESFTDSTYRNYKNSMFRKSDTQFWESNKLKDELCNNINIESLQIKIEKANLNKKSNYKYSSQKKFMENEFQSTRNFSVIISKNQKREHSMIIKNFEPKIVKPYKKQLFKKE